MNLRSLTPALGITVTVVLVISIGCGRTGRSRGGQSCYDSADCTTTDGSLEACINAVCEEVDCLSSSDCPLGTICDVESLDYSCDNGCLSNSDCAAGSTCEDGACITYGCRSTVLDCDFGEVCNEATGTCEETTQPHCGTCSMANNEWDDGGTTTTCDDVLISSSECGGVGDFCINWYAGEPLCYISCEEQADCPAGYQCQQVVRPLPVGCADELLYLGLACVAECPLD